MYKLLFEKRALGILNKLETEVKDRIWKKLQLCKEDPFRLVEHLENIGGYKLRIGDYRLIVDIDTSSNTITILKVGLRKNIYD